MMFLLQAKAFLQTAASLAPHMYEPHFNFAVLSDKVCTIQLCFFLAAFFSSMMLADVGHICMSQHSVIHVPTLTQ